MTKEIDEVIDDFIDEERGVSKKDQLTYRTTLQKMVELNLFSMETFQLERFVKAFRTALFFQVPGLSFKDRILEREKELEKEEERKLKKELKKVWGVYYKPQKWDDLSPPDKAQIRNKMHKWKYTTLLNFLLNLLAEHDALMKAKGFVEAGMDMEVSEKKE